MQKKKRIKTKKISSNEDLHEENISKNKNSDFVKTPEFISKKKFEINPLTNDNKSFMVAVILSLYSKTIGRNNTRPNNVRKCSDTINGNGINFPPTDQDYAMLEKNSNNIALNVFEIDDEKKVRYIYHSTLNERKDKINLILLEKKHVYLKSTLCMKIGSVHSDINSGSDNDSD